MSSFTALTASLARTNLRDPVTLFVSFVLPPALLCILALSVGDQPGGDGRSTVDAMSPNVMGLGVACVGMFVGAMNTAEWRQRGVVRVLRCAPTSAKTILASALTIVVALALTQAVLVAVVGVLPAVGVRLSAWAGLSVVPVLLGTLLFYSLGVLVGLAVRTVSAVYPTVIITVVLMAIASGIMIPLELLPRWVQPASNVVPLTHLLNALRWPLTGVGGLGDALIGVGVLGVSGVAVFWVATRLMRWE